MSDLDKQSGPGPPSSSFRNLTMKQASISDNVTNKSEEPVRRKIGHRRVTQEGTVTYKKKPTSEIQRALQLGIHHQIGSVQQKAMRDLLIRDFDTVETVHFPPSGSKTTPAHSLSDFRFRTIAPVAFRNFRAIYQIEILDFLNSLCNNELRELSNPGASGSIFYITQDDEFIIKTVQHREGDFLRALLPSYFLNLMQHPRTLLPKFYGFYCYHSASKNIRFIIMNNLLPSTVKIHEKFDLKGSTHKRRASPRELAKSSPTLKDLDFRERHPGGIWLEAETYDALIHTIERDCLVLESLRIMDYSMLLGIHNLDQAKRERIAQKTAPQVPTAGSNTSSGGDESEPQVNHVVASSCSSNIRGSNGTNSTPRSPLRVIPTGNSFTPGPLRASPYRSPPGADGERNIHFHTPGEPGNSFVSPSSLQRVISKFRAGKRVAAYSTAMESIEASCRPVELDREELDLIPSGGIPARSSSGDRLLLYLGIIDILQSYRLLKKLEHGFKALAVDGESVSVAPPSFYSQRFQEFLSRNVFKRIQSPTKHLLPKRPFGTGPVLPTIRSSDESYCETPRSAHPA